LLFARVGGLFDGGCPGLPGSEVLEHKTHLHQTHQTASAKDATGNSSMSPPPVACIRLAERGNIFTQCLKLPMTWGRRKMGNRKDIVEGPDHKIPFYWAEILTHKSIAYLSALF